MKQDSNILSIDSNFDLKLESFASEIMRQSKLTRKELKLEEIIEVQKKEIENLKSKTKK